VNDDMERIQDAVDTTLASLADDPWLAQKVMAQAKGGFRVKRKLSAGMAFCLLLLVISATAWAVTLLHEHQVKLFENVTWNDLLPEQWRQYDVCHRVSGGYLIGGFLLGEDYIAPMGEEDRILYLDESFTPVWSLGGSELAGCLFDRVEESRDAFYLGMERRKENGEWRAALMKAGKDGRILWTYEGDADLRIRDFLVTEEGTAYCAGQSGTGDESEAVLLTIDPDGGLRQEQTFAPYGATALNAVSEWGNGMIAAGQSEKGVLLLQLSPDGEVIAHMTYPVDQSIDFARLGKLADGRTALILTVSSDALSGDATEETRYMIIPDGIFGS